MNGNYANWVIFQIIPIANLEIIRLNANIYVLICTCHGYIWP